MIGLSAQGIQDLTTFAAELLRWGTWVVKGTTEFFATDRMQYHGNYARGQRMPQHLIMFGCNLTHTRTGEVWPNPASDFLFGNIYRDSATMSTLRLS
jgi:hypothetical protein